MKARFKKIFASLVIAAWFMISFGAGISVEAAGHQTPENSSYAYWSPTHEAFTLDRRSGFSPVWYSAGTSFTTGIPFKDIGEDIPQGMHIYNYDRMDDVPIYKWEVFYTDHTCIHGGSENNVGSYGENTIWAGLAFKKAWDGTWNTVRINRICGAKLDSGWFPICADCGEIAAPLFFYSNSESLSSIKYLNMNMYSYYSLCPYEGSIEQGAGLKHSCKAYSYNMYKVNYNIGYVTTSTQRMMPSYHMWDNQTEYEGETVSVQRSLTPNTFWRTGYVFLGWNSDATRAAQGIVEFTDGQEILNLTEYDYHYDPRGTVQLYAVWRKSESTLIVDPNGGIYSDPNSMTKGYGETYVPDSNKLTPPEGPLVRFVVKGGGVAPDPIRATLRFNYWNMLSLVDGYWDGVTYYFEGPDGSVDTVRAEYAVNPVKLPKVPGYSGWYYDEDCTQSVPGDEIVPNGDMTLYTDKVALTLYSKENYTPYGGSGAADLNWELSRSDIGSTYKLYQSGNGGNAWDLIAEPSDVGNVQMTTINETRPGSYSYSVPATGIYVLTANGAQGGNIGSYTGGKGGSVSALFWLQKGDTLNYTIGGTNGYNGGGTGIANIGASGGGYTSITLVRNGVSTDLLIGGGGGGATTVGNGNVGGAGSNLVENRTGQNGGSGGGGGYRGGAAGVLTYHSHTTVCNHIHVVNEQPCYTYVTHTHQGDYSSGGPCFESVPRYCGACASYWSHGEGVVCAGCGTNHPHRSDGCMGGGYRISCGKTNEWVLTCTTQYDCGKTPSTIERSTPSYGGSNYVYTLNNNLFLSYNGTVGDQAGVVSGNGSVKIESKNVGYLLDNYLNDVASKDKAAPDPVDLANIVAQGSGVNVSFAWLEPEDHGTEYVFKAESYAIGGEDVLAYSNLTSEILTSGVKGYYVLVDGNPNTNYNSSFKLQTGRSVTVTFFDNHEPQTKYVHIATVDVAGNVATTVHKRLDYNNPASTVPIKYDPYTEPLKIQNGPNVYAVPGQSRNWYVKADGETAFYLDNTVKLDGPATNKYQLNYAGFHMTGSGSEGMFSQKVQTMNVSSGTIDVPGSMLSPLTDGNPLLSAMVVVSGKRYDDFRAFDLSQSFVADSSLDGVSIRVIPRAGVDDGYVGRGIVWSNISKDAINGITIIPDAYAPNIHFTANGEPFTQDILDRNEIDPETGEPTPVSIIFEAWCDDVLSGVDFYEVTVENLDNHNEYTWTLYGNEHWSVEAIKDGEDVLWVGDINIRITAYDHVGNVSVLESGATEFDLEAWIDRALAEIDGNNDVFQRGETGILRFTVWGYPDYVEVEFPEEWMQLDPTLNTTYVYRSGDLDYPDYVEHEDYEFMIPLGLPPYTVLPTGITYDDFSAMITVRAYKNGVMLEAHPRISGIAGNGTIADDLRDRLK